MRSLIILFICSPLVMLGQVSLTIEDYNRAVQFQWSNLNNKRVFNLNVGVNWFSDKTGGWFITQNKEGKTFNKVDLKTTQVSPLFDHARLAKVLSDSSKEDIKPSDLPLSSIKYLNPKHFEFRFKGKNYRLNLDQYTIELQKDPVRIPNEEESPDGNWIAFTKDFNLYIKHSQTEAQNQLSTLGRKNYEYASNYGWADIMVGENGERPQHLEVNWSADSKWIQTYICDLRSAQKMYLLDWSVDTLHRARLLSYYRGSPGDTAMVYMIPTFFNVETGEEFRPQLPRNTHINTVSFRWSKDPGIIYASYSERGFKKVHLIRLDLTTKTQKELYFEESKTNIDNFGYWLVEEKDLILITSEKDGWKQIYSLSLKTGTLQPLTQGNFYVHSIDHINREKGEIIFSASGKETNRNPYHRYSYKIFLNGKGLKLLTPEDANHDVIVSPDGLYLSDNMSSIAQPTKTVLRDTKSGKILSSLSTASISELETLQWKYAEEFTSTGRDGQTVVYGALWKPTNFNPTKKYPVIDQSYTGPHTNMFPRNFITSLTRSNQALAELGFIVVTIDGLGSAGRSKEFHNYSYKNMGKNLTDHVLAIQQLGRKHSWIDTTRVGIFGHSAGGFDAGHAVLEFPDFYKVAVASSADHDFRMEKAWWPEMYMGWPVDSTYHQTSNITMAGNLKGKLLITHGGIDENVNPSATFKLAEALVRADKEFDMLIFPSQRHGYQGKFNDYFTKKRWNYFVEHLLGAEPIWNFELTLK